MSDASRSPSPMSSAIAIVATRCAAAARAIKDQLAASKLRVGERTPAVATDTLDRVGVDNQVDALSRAAFLRRSTWLPSVSVVDLARAKRCHQDTSLRTKQSKRCKRSRTRAVARERLKRCKEQLCRALIYAARPLDRLHCLRRLPDEVLAAVGHRQLAAEWPARLARRQAAASRPRRSLPRDAARFRP